MIETDDMPEEVARCIEDLTEHFDEFERMIVEPTVF